MPSGDKEEDPEVLVAVAKSSVVVELLLLLRAEGSIAKKALTATVLERAAADCRHRFILLSRFSSLRSAMLKVKINDSSVEG